MLRSVSLGLAGALLAAPAQAQTTHLVQLFSVSFSPADIVIEQGDTVRWDWVTGVHDVTSGATDFQTVFPDGIFFTGQPTANDIFEFTYDGAVLANFPKTGNVYPYYCSVHLPVMTGTVTVINTSGSVEPYGTANPEGSLRFTQGNARFGQQMTFGVDNTADPSSGPGLALVAFAVQPDPNFPNGTLIPGFGMAPGAAGEFLLSLQSPDPFLTLGPQSWGGSGNPASFNLDLPNNPNLVGIDLYAQGAVLDPGVANGIGVTNGLRITIGA